MIQNMLEISLNLKCPTTREKSRRVQANGTRNGDLPKKEVDIV